MPNLDPSCTDGGDTPPEPDGGDTTGGGGTSGGSTGGGGGGNAMISDGSEYDCDDCHYASDHHYRML